MRKPLKTTLRPSTTVFQYASKKKTSAYKSKKTSLKIVSKTELYSSCTGSAFTEGIDTLGGQIETAMVISPALPEVNPLNEMKLQYEKQSDPSTAFQKTYISLLFKNPSGTRSTCTGSWAFGKNSPAWKTFSSARIS